MFSWGGHLMWLLFIRTTCKSQFHFVEHIPNIDFIWKKENVLKCNHWCCSAGPGCAQGFFELLFPFSMPFLWHGNFHHVTVAHSIWTRHTIGPVDQPVQHQQHSPRSKSHFSPLAFILMLAVNCIRMHLPHWLIDLVALCLNWQLATEYKYKCM